MFGFLVLDKPTGITSRQAVTAVQKIVRPHKVGHTGTLDPLAQGVLVICIGPATRLSSEIQSMPKRYTAEFQFGVTSESDDSETEVKQVPDADPFSESMLNATCQKFLGSIEQIPPKYSAVKIGGKRAYRLARQNKEFEIQPRAVEIFSIAIRSFNYPSCKLEIECGSGTYIRSLGRDIARELQTGAIMTGLVRNSVGAFQLIDAIDFNSVDIKKIEKQLNSPLRAFPDLAQIQLSEAQIKKLVNGVAFELSEFENLVPNQQSRFLAVCPKGKLLAVLEKKQNQLVPTTNFIHYHLQHH